MDKKIKKNKKFFLVNDTSQNSKKIIKSVNRWAKRSFLFEKEWQKVRKKKWKKIEKKIEGGCYDPLKITSP